MEIPIFQQTLRHMLKWASEALGQRLIIVFDEFDRLSGLERGLFADTIKDLSDNSIEVTIIVVGVASDTVHLIAEHTSITRCLRQIHMPLMSRRELEEIIIKAMPRLK